MIPRYFKACWKEFKVSDLGQKVAVVVVIALVLLLFMFLGAQVAHAASVVTGTFTDNSTSERDVFVVKVSWTAHTDGTVTSTQLDTPIYGYLSLIVVDPGTPSPQALYDITITDATGLDVTGGALANLSATVGLQTLPIIGPTGTTAYAGRYVAGNLTFNLSGNNVNGAKGDVYLYFKK